MASDVVYDPFDSAIADDPYPIYERLRDEAPLYYAASTGTYVLSRYEDVMWALGNADLFSSDAMRGVLMGMPTGTGIQALPRSEAMGNVVAVDPPAHTELRRIVNRGFTPKRIGDWHDRIAEMVDDLLAAWDDRDPFDVVAALAAPLPVRVIAELLGADPDAADQFRKWADTLTRSMSGSTRGAATVDDEAAQAVFGLATYLAGEIEDRQRIPRDDLLGVLVRAHGEDVLEQAEALGFAALLLFAGTETTTNLIGNAVWALLTHPEELDRLAGEPERLRAVLEETLRWESPVQYVFRRATAPFERHGVEVPVDSIVTLVLAAANRDPRHYGDTAGRFDPDRTVAGHVGFGFGPHFCLGASLARAEASIALGSLDLRDTVLLGTGLEMIDSSQFRGRRRLELGGDGSRRKRALKQTTTRRTMPG